MSGPRGLSAIVLAGIVALGPAVAGCATGGGAGRALERGDAAFRAGDYAEASEAYGAVLASRGAETDESVYLRLAVIHLVLGTPDRDPGRARQILERMIEDHPRGRLREVAETILSLQARVASESREAGARVERLEARIRELERQVEALKSIDLEGRRPPPD